MYRFVCYILTYLHHFYLHNRVSPLLPQGSSVENFEIREVGEVLGCLLCGYGSTVGFVVILNDLKWRLVFWYFLARLIEIGQTLSSWVDMKGGGPVVDFFKPLGVTLKG